MIQAVIFDFDGVIADTEHLHFDAYRAVLEPQGLAFSYAEYCEHYMAFDSFGCFRQRAADLSLDVDTAELRRWVEAKNDVYETRIASTSVPPLPGALEAVRSAAAQGPVAVCTGAVLRDIAPLLEAYGLRPLLSAVVTADDVAVSKPDPESYTRACALLKQNPGDCLAIEDTPGGLQSAKGAGCRTLGVTTTHTAKQLRPFADQIRPSLTGWTLSPA